MMKRAARIVARSAPRRVVDCGKPWARRVGRAVLSGAILAALLCPASGETAGGAHPGRVNLPADAKNMCPLEPTEPFANWFKTGRVEVNGVVLPPDSLGSPPGNDCDFYKWSARTFLWLTSSARGGGMTFESAEFFAVSPPDRMRKRDLTRGSEDGVDARARINLTTVRGTKPVEAGGQPVSNGVLMTQGGSLVYYANYVNDVFAYYLTGVKTSRISLPDIPPPVVHQVPSNQHELDKVIAFARWKDRYELKNPNTLVVVVKSSWIKADGLDQRNYITIKATIPKFRKVSKTLWTPDGTEKDVTLALVGMHVVASAGGRPRMVWATFEHVDNVPTGGYGYINTSGAMVPANPPARNTWHFSQGVCTGDRKKPRMIEANGKIKGNAGQTIGPSDTCRVNAWGTANRPDDEDEQNNTRIIDVNHHTIGRLPDGDVRKNYLLIGTNWNFTDGASDLANATMETYTQSQPCFDCHTGNITNGRLNHLWNPIRELP